MILPVNCNNFQIAASKESPINQKESVCSSRINTLVQDLFAREQEICLEMVRQDSRFAPFSLLSNRMWTLLIGEKKRLFLKSSLRLLVEPDGTKIRRGDMGVTPEEEKINTHDLTHPSHFSSFVLEGFWLPEEEGEIFSCSHTLSSPLIRTDALGREILFLIHPKSQELFTPLRQRYWEKRVEVPAIALSSSRTLLVAINGSYLFVKVSLHEKITKALRILSRKECGGSVANSHILESLNSKMEFLKEDFSFVPKKELLNIDVPYEKARQEGAGMIHRIIPESIWSSEEYVIPLFALLGVGNRPLLTALIEQSQLTPTGFVMQHIFDPLVDLFLQLLYDNHTSIESHGQNVMIAIDASAPAAIRTRFLYRDMGGINTLLPRDNGFASLPPLLQSNDFFYFNTHVEDAASNLERIALLAFDFTEQFFNEELYCKRDPQFAAWKQKMIDRGFSPNWTSLQDPNHHTREIPREAFYQYGYFEKKLAASLICKLYRKGKFFGKSEEMKSLLARIGVTSKGEDLIDPCVLEQDWFIRLVKCVYSERS